VMVPLKLPPAYPEAVTRLSCQPEEPSNRLERHSPPRLKVAPDSTITSPHVGITFRRL
jgi:hypothetical protein